MTLVPAEMGTVLLELGITVARERHEELWALCPNPDHADRKPSWSINTRSGLHNCYSCQYAGTFDQLVCERLGLSPWDGRTWTREHALSALSFDDLPTYQETTVVSGVRKQVVAYSEANLVDFFAPPTEALDDRGLSKEAADHYGVLWDTTQQGWVLPVRTLEGKLMGWQFKSRRVFDNYPADIAKSATLFGVELLEPGEPAVLVESPLDCLRLRDAGVTGAVSSYGAKVSVEQMRMLLGVTDTLVLALDDDAAGYRMTQRLVHGGRRDGVLENRAWKTAFDLRVFAYGSVTDDEDDPWGTAEDEDAPTDVGEMQDDEQVRWGHEHAVPAVRYPGSAVELRSRRTVRPAQRTARRRSRFVV